MPRDRLATTRVWTKITEEREEMEAMEAMQGPPSASQVTNNLRPNGVSFSEAKHLLKQAFKAEA